jgi:hypothetical protein
MRLRLLLFFVMLGCGLADVSVAAPLLSSTPPDLDWDATFAPSNQSRPLHFIGHYQDARGTHQLEEWKLGDQHLRRRTDHRIDLHADAVRTPKPGQPADYVWQVIDLRTKIDHRISSQAMLQAGLMYNFWSMAHVLTRPAGRFHLTRLPAEPAFRVGSLTCDWYQIAPESQPVTRVCWSSSIAVPIRMEAEVKDASGHSNWAPTFSIDRIDRAPVPASAFRVNTAGLRIQDLDQITTED